MKSIRKPGAGCRKLTWLGSLAFCLLAVGSPLLPAQDADPVLRAMKDELERSRQLRIVSLDAPYFFEYRVEDVHAFSVVATMGALVSTNQAVLRAPAVRVRVGDYTFDNSNHIYSDAYSGSRYDPDQLPLENDYRAFRQVLWLATDRAYKTAEEAIARKRSSLKNMNVTGQLPDFSKAPAVQAVQPIVRRNPMNETLWKDRVVKLSAVFNEYPQVLSSGVELQTSLASDYVVNSEGTALRVPDDLAYIRVRAFGLASDGTPVRDAEVFQAFEPEQLPVEAELRRGAAEVAKNVTALAQAQPGEAYTGPVLFEARAAAQLFGQLLGDNLKITRKPIADPGRTAPHLESELENRIASRILPEWMDVVDDPTQAEWRGHILLGHYQYDMEGVAPLPLTLVDQGVLKTFLLTRTPVVKAFEVSNGRARLPGSFGSRSPAFGNMFVRASRTTAASEMKNKLIELCRQRNKPYGMLVKKLDYPSSASPDEFRRLATAMAQSPGGTRLVTEPLLVYRVYLDGREELVRSLRFRGLSTRSFRDIMAASDESYVFDFIDSNAPMALMGAGNYVVTSSVIAPAVLFDELEFEAVHEDLPKPPIVPPPVLSTESRSLKPTALFPPAIRLLTPGS